MTVDTSFIVISDTLKLFHSYSLLYNNPMYYFLDSLNSSKIILDTIFVKNLSTTQSIPVEIIGLLGVIIGGIISFATSLIIEKQKTKIAIKRDFFSRRFESYNDIMKLVYKGYSVIEKTHPDESLKIYPKAYDTFEGLRDWLNTMVDFIDQSLLLIDQNTYRKFSELNRNILEHIRIITSNPDENNRDLFTRNLGRDKVEVIQTLTKNVMDAIREHLNNTYKIKIEEIR